MIQIGKMTLNLTQIFHIPGYDKELILFIKYVLSVMICYKKIIFFHNLQLFSNSGNGCLYLLKDRFNNYHFTEIPIHFKINVMKYNGLHHRNWLLWLEELKDFLRFQFKKHSLYSVIDKFLKEEKIFFEKSVNDIKYIERQFIDFKREMIEPWFLYKYELIGEVTDEVMIPFTKNFQILLNQISKKEKLSLFIFKIFKKHINSIENAILNEDLIKLKKISSNFKNDIHEFLDENFSFVQTKNINYYEWLISFYQFYCECETIDYELEKRISKLNLIFHLGYEYEQDKNNINYQLFMFNNLEKRTIMDISLDNVEKSKQVHPLFRGEYLKNLLKM